MQDALADILDTEKDYISETFVQDHLEDIQKAADGDADAIDRLHKALAVDMVAHIAVDNGLDEAQVQNLINQVQGLQIPDIEVGAKLDSSQFSNDEKAFLDQMLEIVENAKIIHLEGQSTKNQLQKKKWFKTSEIYYFKKHHPHQAWLVKLIYSMLYLIDWLILKNKDSKELLKVLLKK